MSRRALAGMGYRGGSRPGRALANGRRRLRGATWINGSAQMIVASGQRCLIAFDAAIAVLTIWRLNQPGSSLPTRGK